MTEQDRLERLKVLFGAMPMAAGVTLGIGDDAAMLAPGTASLVWTIDAAVEGVHFTRAWMSLEDVGWRSLMAAASDLAAMGASPRGVLSALVLPETFSDAELESLARGQADAARALGTAVIGGNLSRGGELSITTSVLGEAATPLRRDGAKVDDVVAVSGEIGLSLAGLLALRRGLVDPRVAGAIARHRRPRARIVEGLGARGVARAAIDLSDGLALDASRLAMASGVGVEIQADALLAAAGPSLAEAAEALSLDPLGLALSGGEDYALLATFPPTLGAPTFHAIGRCTRERGLWIVTADGTRRPLEARGFDHFQKSTSM